MRSVRSQSKTALSRPAESILVCASKPTSPCTFDAMFSGPTTGKLRPIYKLLALESGTVYARAITTDLRGSAKLKQFQSNCKDGH